MFLIAEDAHLKWLDDYTVWTATSAATIQRLREMFNTHGLPHMVVSGNAAVFTSAEFQGFLTSSGLRHKKSSPYKPSTNGLFERAVQTVKRALKKITGSGGSLKMCISRVLVAYRSTSHATTGRSPMEMLFGHTVRTRWYLLRADAHAKVFQNQECMTCRETSTRPTRALASSAEV